MLLPAKHTRSLPYERRLGEPFTGPIIPFGSMVEYHPVSAKDLSRLHQFGKKVLPWIFLGYVFTRGEIWKGDILIEDIEELEKMDASEIHAGRLNAKEVLTPMSGEKFIFPIADGTVKLSGGDQDLRTSTLIRDPPDRGEEQGNLQGESDGSSSKPLRDSSWYDGEARNDFWSISSNFIYRHHVELRVKLYVPREESFPIPLRYIDVTRATSTTLDVMLERCIDELEYWRKPRPVRLVDRIQTIHQIGRKTSRWVFMSGRRLTKKHTTSRPDFLWPEIWKDMSEAAQRKEKTKVGYRKNRSLTTLEDCAVFTALIQRMKSSKKLLKTRGESWKLRCQQQRLARSGEETCRTPDAPKTKYACIVEADESSRKRLEGTLLQDHEDHIEGKWINSLNHHNLVHKFIPMLQAMKIPDAKATVERE